MAGKLIVIEGSDSSGKTTQTEKLQQRLTAEGKEVVTFSFPNYGHLSARAVEEYLKPKEGFALPGRVGPHTASLGYSIDRFALAPEITKAKGAGKIVIMNRYTDSNSGHQGGKIKDPEERAAFLKWLYWVEYDLLKIPKPDLVVILQVEVVVSLKLMEWRGRSKDWHEADTEHLMNAEAAYLWLAEQYPNDHKVVACTSGGEILPRETISERVYETVKPLL